MAIFNKSNNQSISETTIISLGAKIEGKFNFSSMLHVDGDINGLVHSDSIVVVGKNGIIKGELKADKVIVNGIFEGELEANSLEILSGGLVSGNIIIKEISIENGGKFIGNSKIEEKKVEFIENNLKE